MIIRPYQDTDEEQVISLWRECDLIIPENDPQQDIRDKLLVQRELFLVGLVDASIVATVMAGYDGHRGWLHRVAVWPSLQRKGLGRQIIHAAEAALTELGCPKINLQVRATNHDVVEFYRRLGFEVEERVSMGKRL